MEISFKRNGRLYNQCYAWLPTQMTSGLWTWFTVYYTREVVDGWIVMNPVEFLIDSQGE